MKIKHVPTRRSRVDRELRKKEIEFAARIVFCERGFEASMEEIAVSAGVAEGTIYTYFESKKVLLIKVLENWYTSILDEFEDQLDAISGSRRKIYYIIWRHLKSLKDDAALARLMYFEVRHSNEYFGSAIYELNRKYTNVLVEICEEGIRDGELRANIPVKYLRDLVFGGIDHLVSGYLYNNKEINIGVAAESIVSLVFDGIAQGDNDMSSLGDCVRRLEAVTGKIETAVSGKNDKGLKVVSD